MEAHCRNDKYAIPCGEGSSICTFEFYACDGVANCPGGEDESIEQCVSLDAFSPLASLECNKKDVFNGSIKIRAVKCDRNSECEFDVDEIGCSLPDYVLIIILICFAIIGILLGKLIWEYTIKDLKVISEDITQLQGDDLKIFLFNVLQTKHSDAIIENFIWREMKDHNGDCSLTIVSIKNSLDSTTTAHVMQAFHKSNKISIIQRLLIAIQGSRFLQK